MDFEDLIEQTIIINYLASKLGLDESWYTTQCDFLFDRTPEETLLSGHGDELIEWLEVRVGLKPGQAF